MVGGIAMTSLQFTLLMIIAIVIIWFIKEEL